MNANNALTPFRIDIPQADIDDLRNRLAHTRRPIPVPDRDDRTHFSRGIPHPLMRRVVDPSKAIGHWSEFSEGGHFPAMEEPELLASDIRAFFRSLS